MTIELISCPACGTKNAAHRKVCLQCGASISTSKGSKTTEGLSFSERLRQLFGIDASTQNCDAVWLSLLKGMKDDDIESTKELKQVVTSFLIPDKISPFKFRANWIALFGLFIDPRRGLLPLSDNDFNPTPSLERFSYVVSRPPGYPEWFLAAYPDVASWFTDRIDKGESVFHNIFGNISDNELLDSDRHLKGEYLRALIDNYRKETGRALECK